MKLEGFYYDGRSSKKYRAAITVLSGTTKALIKVEDSLIYDDEISFLRVSARLGNTPREIRLPDDSVVIIEDNDGVDALSLIARKGKGWGFSLASIENKGAYVLISAALVLFFTWFIFTVGIPKTSKLIAFSMPYFEDISQNLDYFSKIDGQMFKPSKLSSEKQNQLTKLFKTNANEDNVSVFYRSTTNSAANAFAFPGKIIVFTDDLVKLAESDHELLAIYFHEEGHIRDRHLARHVIQNSFISVGLFLLFGDLYGFEVASTIPSTLLFLSYSREFEREADEYSSRNLINLGVSTYHFVSILEKLQESITHKKQKSFINRSVAGYWSSHPITAERMKEIENYSP